MDFERSCGILVHPTSFPGKYGIGDLGGAADDFLNFLKAAGQSLWQILPLGPTSFGDSPYQSFSAFAGNPLLLSPDLLVEEGLLTEADVSQLPEFDPHRVDYGSVIKFKYNLFRKAFENLNSNGHKEYKASFAKFCTENEYWLRDFVLFVALKNYFIEKRRFEYESPGYLSYKKFNQEHEYLTDQRIDDYYYGAVWTSWPEDIKKREKATINYWTEKLTNEIEFQKFLQYEFFREWLALKKRANEMGIKIIGDIPIFVALDSADVWASPELYLLDENYQPQVVAGVPPDYFSETGQLWGNPLYKWERHKANGYKWWISRLRSALHTADIVRIDHFRGFESYWAVPGSDLTAENGRWIKGPGKDLFKALEDALGRLPIIAEDLGIITKDVEKLRDDLGLPGMKVLQFGFEGGPDGDALPHNFKTCRMAVYTGTHDNDTTEGWYEKAEAGARDYFRRYLNVSGNDASRDLIRAAYASCAAFALVPLQDCLGLPSGFRMNAPGTTTGNWQFRYTGEMLTEDLAGRLKYLKALFNR